MRIMEKTNDGSEIRVVAGGGTHAIRHGPLIAIA